MARAWVLWRDVTGSPGSRWDRGAPGGKSGEKEGWEKENEWTQAGIGARAEGDGGTGTSQLCPQGKVRQDRWEGKSLPAQGIIHLGVTFNQGKVDKWLIHTFYPCSDHPSGHIPARAHPMVQISWHRAPDTPRFPSLASHHHPAGREKPRLQARRDVIPGHPLLSSLCHEGLHHPPQTRVGINSPKIPKLAWARAHQQTGSSQAFPLPS